MTNIEDAGERAEGNLDQRLIDAIASARGETRMAVRTMIAWLASCPEKTAGQEIHRHLTGKSSGDGLAEDGVAYERVFTDAVREWRDTYLGADYVHLSKITRKRRVIDVRTFLKRASGQGIRGLPARFDPQWVAVDGIKKERIESSSLASLSWPELNDTQCHERERAALDAVRSAFVAEFDAQYRLFAWGQSLLRGDEPEGADVSACSLIRRALAKYQKTLCETGKLVCGKLDNDKTTKVVQDMALWKAAGCDISEMFKEKFRYTTALKGCLGPLKWMVKTAAGVVLCDTGWNYQPLRDLPRNPYVFRSADSSHIASRPFIESYKNRAGHNVLAYLGEHEVLKGRRLEEAQAAWNDTALLHDPENGLDGYAALAAKRNDKQPSAYDILTKYELCANTLRRECGERRLSDAGLADSFWIYISGSFGEIARLDGLLETKRSFADNMVLSRHGITSQTIRKTVLSIRRQDSGSIAAVKSPAQHADTSVLMPHYLNTPAVNAELDESIRQFQNAMEAIVTREIDAEKVAISFQREVGASGRLLKVADRCGIASVLGVSREASAGQGAMERAVYFEPSDERLADLYAIHKALTALRNDYRNRARFRKDYLPLLALTKAIGREVFRLNLGPQYRRAARRVSKALRSGEVILPIMED